MEAEIEDSICDGRAHHVVMIVLDSEEAPLYDYWRLRPRGILLAWWRYDRRWHLRCLLFQGDSVLKNGKLGKRRNVRFTIFKDPPSPQEVERLPAPWQHLIREHKPGSPKLQVVR
jgi:hypothetical protein